MALLPELSGRPRVLAADDDEATRGLVRFHCLNALESGADDYLTKPFSRRELLAHTRAEKDPTQPSRIVTARGAGYKFGDL